MSGELIVTWIVLRNFNRKDVTKLIVYDQIYLRFSELLMK